METLNLNPQQETVVGLGPGAYLVDAAAGVGKTRVITERMIRLVSEGVDANRILLVTFTVKAAAEMRSRVAARTGRRPGWATNFHRLCTRLLREIPELGSAPDFTIADSNDSKGLVKEILREIAPGIDAKDHRKVVGAVLRQVERTRNLWLWPDYGEPQILEARKQPCVATAAVLYEERLAQRHQLDFDLMLFKVALALRRSPEARAKVAGLWDYIMVDEAQDTDPVQLDILKAIATHGNVMMTGDMDQGIYSFRGAQPMNMQFFVEHFKAKVYPIEINYRSREEILAVANMVIKNNTARFPKALKPSRGNGGRVSSRRFVDSRAQATYVAQEIAVLLRAGVPADQVAVLFRVGSSSRLLEAALSKLGIKHRVLGSKRFWDRTEVRDVVAYGRVFVGRPDPLAWRRVTENPRLGIGEAGWKRVLQAGNPEEGLMMAHPNKVYTLMGALNRTRAMGDTADGLMELLKQAGYLAHLEGSCASQEEAAQRLANVVEAIRVIRETGTVSAFLDEVVLGLTDADLGEEEAPKEVTLATIHAAKGLEWEHVILADLAEDVLPHGLAIRDGEHAVEEERRLFYVAVTRARRSLLLAYPGQIAQQDGSSKTADPSRFLAEAGLNPMFQKVV